jgi:hypothetical protein
MPEKNAVPIVTEAANSFAAVTPDAYANEPIRFAPLQVVDLAAEAAAVSEPYRNRVMSRVNGSCLRLAVFSDVFRWHHHPTSDELFLVVEGKLVIDLMMVPNCGSVLGRLSPFPQERFIEPVRLAGRSICASKNWRRTPCS